MATLLLPFLHDWNLWCLCLGCTHLPVPDKDDDDHEVAEEAYESNERERDRCSGVGLQGHERLVGVRRRGGGGGYGDDRAADSAT